MARKRNGNDNETNNGNNGDANMAKLNKAQTETLTSFFETVGWGTDDETEMVKLTESLEKAKNAVKTLEAEINGFGQRKDKAAELLGWFDSGPLSATASPDDKIAFLCSSLKVRPKRAANAASGNDVTYKATDEEKESVMECLDAEGKTVGEVAKECGLETKDVSRIAKALLADGTARKEGERRGTRYFLVSEALDDDDDEVETE